MKKINRRTLRLNEEYEEYLNKMKEAYPLCSENSLICLALKNYHDNVLNGKYSNRRKIDNAKVKYNEFIEKSENKAKNNDLKVDSNENDLPLEEQIRLWREQIANE